MLPIIYGRVHKLVLPCIRKNSWSPVWTCGHLSSAGRVAPAVKMLHDSQSGQIKSGNPLGISVLRFSGRFREWSPACNHVPLNSIDEYRPAFGVYANPTATKHYSCRSGGDPASLRRRVPPVSTDCSSTDHYSASHAEVGSARPSPATSSPSGRRCGPRASNAVPGRQPAYCTT